MSKKKKEEVVEERPDEEILIGELDLELPGGIQVTVTPWSFGTYSKIAPVIDKTITIIEKSGVDVSAMSFVGDYQREWLPRMINNDKFTDEEKKRYTAEASKAGAILMRVFAKVAPQVITILESACNLTKAEIEEMNPAAIFLLATVVYQANPTVLGNCYPSFEDMTEE